MEKRRGGGTGGSWVNRAPHTRLGIGGLGEEQMPSCILDATTSLAGGLLTQQKED